MRRGALIERATACAPHWRALSRERGGANADVRQILSHYFAVVFLRAWKFRPGIFSSARSLQKQQCNVRLGFRLISFSAGPREAVPPGDWAGYTAG